MQHGVNMNVQNFLYVHTVHCYCSYQQMHIHCILKRLLPVQFTADQHTNTPAHQIHQHTRYTSTPDTPAHQTHQHSRHTHAVQVHHINISQSITSHSSHNVTTTLHTNSLQPIALHIQPLPRVTSSTHFVTQRPAAVCKCNNFHIL